MSATAVPVEPDDDEGAGAIGLPVVMMLALAVLLFLPDQMKELYRIYAEAWPGQGWRNPALIIAVASMLALSFFIWRLARELTRLPAAQRLIPDRWSRLVFDWTPRLVCLLPWAGVAMGIWTSFPPSVDSPPPAFGEFYPSLRNLHDLLVFGLQACSAIALALFIVVTVTELAFARWGKRPFGRPFLVRLWPVYTAIILGVSIAGFVLDGTWFVYIGVIPILIIWFLAITGLLSYLWLYTERVRSIILAALVIGLITFDYFGLTDNHRFRHAPIDFNWAKQERPGIEEAFDRWLASRNDMATYREGGRPYPVYVVAAEGGGLYAAYHVAKFLARMQDLCPNFSQHLFSISAVSGGSLGAAMFASLARDDAKNQEHVPCRALQRDGRFERRVDRLLRHDFLSHVTTATLFQDFVQRFIPIPIYPLDRARKLEASFENAWASSLPGRPNRMAESFVGSCGVNGRDCLEGAAPALVLNLTQIETGMQLALSPFNLDETGPPKTKSGKIYDALAVADIDMPLSTAVGLSARFPWITPSGWYQLPRTSPDDPVRTYRFADGGYAEGSGAGTGYKIAQLLTERIKAKSVNATVHFIMLTATSPPIERNYIDPPNEAGYGEFSLPFVAFSSARRGQAFARVYDIAIGSTDQLRISQGQIYDALIPLAIGWHLSKATHAYVDLYTGDPKNCRDIKPDITNHWTMAPTYIVQHDCLTKSIVDELSPPR